MPTYPNTSNTTYSGTITITSGSGVATVGSSAVKSTISNQSIVLGGGTTAADSGLYFSGPGTNGGIFYYKSVNKLIFATAGNERCVFDSNGNFGIGTTEPAQKLHVDGNVKIGDWTIQGARMY